MSVTKRLVEIQQRKKQIRADVDEAQKEMEGLESQIEEKVDEAVEAALEALEAKIEGMAEEIDALAEEEVELREKKEAARNKISAPAVVHSRGSGSEAEKRGRDLRQQRAVTISGGSLVKPVGTSPNVNPTMGMGASSIVDLVKTQDMLGLTEYQEPYVTESPNAKKTTENTDAPADEVKFAYASIKPITIAIYSEISKEATKLNNTAYYETVVDAARKALRREVSKNIVLGDTMTNPTFVGILQAPAISTAADLPIAEIDATTLRKIAFHHGGDEDIVGEGVLFLSKVDLARFGDIRGEKEKKAVYEITPDSSNTNIGIIKDGGLAVRYCLNNNISPISNPATETDAYTMFYGVPSAAYECGIFSDFTVKVSEEAAFRKRMLAVLGEVMIGGNVIIKDGFVRVKKGA